MIYIVKRASEVAFHANFAKLFVENSLKSVGLLLEMPASNFTTDSSQYYLETELFEVEGETSMKPDESTEMVAQKIAQNRARKIARDRKLTRLDTSKPFKRIGNLRGLVGAYITLICQFLRSRSFRIFNIVDSVVLSEFLQNMLLKY